MFIRHDAVELVMGKFVIKTTKDGQYMFNLHAVNGQVICTSESYKTLESARNGIESVRKNCAAGIEDQTKDGFETLKNPKWELYKDKAGEFRFRLKASNGETIVAGEGYTTKENALNGISSIGRNAPDAKVEELLD